MGNELDDLKYAWEYLDTIIARFEGWENSPAIQRALPHLKEAFKEISVPLANEYIQEEISKREK